MYVNVFLFPFLSLAFNALALCHATFMCPYVCLNVFQLFDLSDEARSTSFIFSFKHNKQRKTWKPKVYRWVILYTVFQPLVFRKDLVL